MWSERGGESIHAILLYDYDCDGLNKSMELSFDTNSSDCDREDCGLPIGWNYVCGLNVTNLDTEGDEMFDRMLEASH